VALSALHDGVEPGAADRDHCRGDELPALHDDYQEKPQKAAWCHTGQSTAIV